MENSDFLNLEDFLNENELKFDPEKSRWIDI